MDPLAHTLVGAALGRAVAGRDVPAAGWIGAIAANAPDWSELVRNPDVWPPRAGGEYLVLHRGITHSFVGAAVEAAVLTGLVGVVLRLWARRAMVPAPLWRWVATCVTATVASHLYLDWQGSYGLRPFLPWSAQDRKSTRLNSSHLVISYAVFCLKKKKAYGIRATARCVTRLRQAHTPRVAIHRDAARRARALLSLPAVAAPGSAHPRRVTPPAGSA